MLEGFNQGFCTLFWDGDWGKCCQIHDLEYGMLVNKLAADWHLFTCVGASNWLIALIMFAGVSIFGWFFYPRKKKQ